MSCEICSNPATLVCLCRNIKICDSCFDEHCLQYSESEHQILPIEESEETYSKDELMQRPDLVQAKIAEELVRLEGFRCSVLQLVDESLSNIKESVRANISCWVEKWTPELEQQRVKLTEALEMLKTTRLIDNLPTEGYPWTQLTGQVPESLISFPDGLQKIDIRFEDAIQVKIEWDFDVIEDNRALPALSSVPRSQDSKPRPDTPDRLPQEEIKVVIPEDAFDRFQLLQSNSELRTHYLEEKRKDERWPLRKSGLEATGTDLKTLSLKGLKGEDVFMDLTLVLLSSPNLLKLEIKSSSPSIEGFKLLCTSLKQLKLTSLELIKSKLSDAHLKILSPALPTSLQHLNLSSNYCKVELLDLTLLRELKELEAMEMHVPASWIESMRTALPLLEIRR